MDKKRWHDLFDEWQLKEIEFARIYATQLKHGTDGHNRLLIIAKLADRLDAVEENEDHKADNVLTD